MYAYHVHVPCGCAIRMAAMPIWPAPCPCHGTIQYRMHANMPVDLGSPTPLQVCGPRPGPGQGQGSGENLYRYLSVCCGRMLCCLGAARAASEDRHPAVRRSAASSLCSLQLVVVACARAARAALAGAAAEGPRRSIARTRPRWQWSQTKVPTEPACVAAA